MGQTLTNPAKRQEHDSTLFRMGCVLDEIDLEIKEGRKQLEGLQKREKLNKDDIVKIKTGIEQLENEYQSRIKFLDRKMTFTPTESKSNLRPSAIDARSVLGQLQEECSRLKEIVKNMREYKDPDYGINLYFIGQLHETIVLLDSLKNINESTDKLEPDAFTVKPHQKNNEQIMTGESAHNVKQDNANDGHTVHKKEELNRPGASHQNGLNALNPATRDTKSHSSVGDRLHKKEELNRLGVSHKDGSKTVNSTTRYTKNPSSVGDRFQRKEELNHSDTNLINSKMAMSPTTKTSKSLSSTVKEIGGKTHCVIEQEYVIVGESAQDTSTIEELKKEVASLKELVVTRDTELRQSKETVDQMQQNIDGLDATLKRSRKQSEELENDKEKIKADLIKTGNICKQNEKAVADKHKELEVAKDNYRSMSTKFDNASAKCNEQRRKISELEKENRQLKESNQSLLTRLSKLAGERLTDNNPAIADLSDRNRPTKLGEMYSELYDNEWTDAYDGLQLAQHTDTDIIRTLKTTLEHTFNFCEEKSGRLKGKIADAVNLLFDDHTEECQIPEHRKRFASTVIQGSAPGKQRPKSAAAVMPSQEVLKMRKMWKTKDGRPLAENAPTSMVLRRHVDADSKIQKLEKEVAESVALIVQKEYMTLMWDAECIPAMKPYIKKCLYLCWMMIVQSPPMSFMTDPKPGERSDTNVYKQYLSSGKYVDYIVWPALMLHEGGPIVCKGVVETRSTQ